MLSFIEVVHIFAKMFSKSSAINVLYMPRVKWLNMFKHANLSYLDSMCLSYQLNNNNQTFMLMLIFSHLQKFWNRQLWKHTGKKHMENPNSKCINFLLRAISPFCYIVFESHLLEMHQNASTSGKELRRDFNH